MRIFEFAGNYHLLSCASLSLLLPLETGVPVTTGLPALYFSDCLFRAFRYMGRIEMLKFHRSLTGYHDGEHDRLAATSRCLAISANITS